MYSKHLSKKVLSCILCLLFTLMVFQKVTAEEIRIGAILPLTGDAAAWGEKGKKGIDLAVEQVNARGGIKKRKLQVIYEDTQALPRLGVTAITKLAKVNRVPVVIGDIVSATTLAAAPVAEKNHIILLAPTASAPAITNAGDYIFRISPSDLIEGKAMAEFASNHDIKKIGILYIQNDYGLGLKNAFTKRFSVLKGTVTDALAYKQDETDFRPYLLKLKNKNPKAIYLISYYKDAALALKQASELGISCQFLGATAVQVHKLIEIAGSAAEGLIYAIPSEFNPKKKTDAVKEFNTAFKRKYGQEPNFVAAHCYDAVMLIAQVMERVGFSATEIRPVLAETKSYEGVTGVISFDENGDVIKPVDIKAVKDGKFQMYRR